MATRIWFCIVILLAVHNSVFAVSLSRVDERKLYAEGSLSPAGAAALDDYLSKSRGVIGVACGTAPLMTLAGALTLFFGRLNPWWFLGGVVVLAAQASICVRLLAYDALGVGV